MPGAALPESRSAKVAILGFVEMLLDDIYGEVPVGFMLAAAGGSDRRIFELAAAMEDTIRV